MALLIRRGFIDYDNNMKLIYAYLLIVTPFLYLSLSRVKADQGSNALASYTNPHSICQYYRSQSIRIDRESDGECLVSVGEGQYIAYTQYYYSGRNWCVKVTQGGRTITSNCIPLGNAPKDSSKNTTPSKVNTKNSQDWWTNALAKAKPGGSFKNDIFNPYWWLAVPTMFTNDMLDPIWRTKVVTNFRQDLFDRSWWWLRYK